MVSSGEDVYIANVYSLVKWILSKPSKLFINITSDCNAFTYLIVIIRKRFYMLSLNLPCLN